MANATLTARYTHFRLSDISSAGGTSCSWEAATAADAVKWQDPSHRPARPSQCIAPEARGAFEARAVLAQYGQ